MSGVNRRVGAAGTAQHAIPIIDNFGRPRSQPGRTSQFRLGSPLWKTNVTKSRTPFPTGQGDSTQRREGAKTQGKDGAEGQGRKAGNEGATVRKAGRRTKRKELFTGAATG
jgi:hypothetical protein